jgi:hypothetical protein
MYMFVTYSVCLSTIFRFDFRTVAQCGVFHIFSNLKMNTNKNANICDKSDLTYFKGYLTPV